MINCDQARELMNGYIDGVLTEAESAAFEEHISCCENCHEEYDILHKIAVDLTKTSAPLPEGFADRLHCALVNEKLASEKKRKSIFTYYRVASGLAAALVIAVVGKFGIYDTYKDVIKERNDVAVQIANKSPADTEKPADVEMPVTVHNRMIEAPAVAEEPVVETPVVEETPVTPNNVPQKAKVTKTEVTKTEETKTEETKMAEGPIVMLEAPPADTTILPAQEEVAAPMTTKMIVQSDNSGLVINEEMNGKSYSGGSSADTDITEADDAEVVAAEGSDCIEIPEEISNVPDILLASPAVRDEAVVITTPVPAVIELIDDHEETILAMRKFLASLVEESAVSQTEEGITVTVSADDYNMVVRCISECKYVKSVGHGVPLDGVGVIIIK